MKSYGHTDSHSRCNTIHITAVKAICSCSPLFFLKPKSNKKLSVIEMKLFQKIPADKIGNFILTVITAFVSTFLMQSCIHA